MLWTLLYTFRDDHAGQGFFVKLEDVVDTIVHIHSNLLPMQEAEVSLFQQGLVFGIIHSLDHSDDFTLTLGLTFISARKRFDLWFWKEESSSMTTIS